MSALSFDEIDAALERHTKMVAETWAWELYLVVLDMLEGSVVKSFQAEAAARVLVAKIAALEVRR